MPLNKESIHLLYKKKAYFQLQKVGVMLYLSYLPTPLLGQDVTQGQFLSGV